MCGVNGTRISKMVTPPIRWTVINYLALSGLTLLPWLQNICVQ